MADNTLKLPDMFTVPPGTKEIVTSDKSTTITIIESLEPKQIVIAVVCLLVLGVVFFIIKNHFSKILVANHKKSPRSAETAGWAMFGALMLAAIGSSLGILDANRFLDLPYVLPMSGAMVIMFIILIMALVSRR